jgi:hypothetical protein
MVLATGTNQIFCGEPAGRLTSPPSHDRLMSEMPYFPHFQTWR